MDEKKHNSNMHDVDVSVRGPEDADVILEESILDLRAIRESRGHTLQALSASTKINPQNLKAIEEQRFDLLPEPIYARAFIDMYAKAVDVDGKKILSLYDQYLINKLAPEGDHYKVLKKIAVKRRHIEVWIGVIVVAGLIALAGFYYLYQWNMDDRQDAEEMSPAAQVEPAGGSQNGSGEISAGENGGSTIAREANLPEVESAPPADLPVTDRTPEVDQAITAETRPVRVAEQPTGAVQQQVGAVEKPESGTEQPTLEGTQPDEAATSDTTVLTEEKPYTLVIEASELTWIQISRDGGPPFEVMLWPGERITERAAERFGLLIGNAGGVDIRFQGRSLGPLGGHGQVIRLTLPTNE